MSQYGFSRRGGYFKASIPTRSKFEDEVVAILEKAKIAFTYETYRITYRVVHTYIPDIVLKNGIFVELKGWFQAKDRTKHLLVQKQHPDLDIRFVFQHASNKLYKGSKTTYAQWCDKHGFKWAEGMIPIEWTKEKNVRL